MERHGASLHGTAARRDGVQSHANARQLVRTSRTRLTTVAFERLYVVRTCVWRPGVSAPPTPEMSSLSYCTTIDLLAIVRPWVSSAGVEVQRLQATPACRATEELSVATPGLGLRAASPTSPVNLAVQQLPVRVHPLHAPLRETQAPAYFLLLLFGAHQLLDEMPR